MVDAIAEIMEHEEHLRTAMLSSDVAQLDGLLSGALVFTNQGGIRLSKEDDLAAHRSGLLKIRKLAPRADRLVRQLGDTAIVCLTADLAGTYAGHAFAGTFAYTRVWQRQEGKWRVEAAHCSAVASPG